MEDSKNISAESRSNLTLEDRKKMSLTGVKEVISFDEYKIILNTSLGKINIRGNNLKMTKLDVQNGDVWVAGKIDSFIYTNSETRKENESIISRLFR